MEQFWFLIDAIEIHTDKLVFSIPLADANPLVSLEIDEAIGQLPFAGGCQPQRVCFRVGEVRVCGCFCPDQPLLPQAAGIDPNQMQMVICASRGEDSSAVIMHSAAQVDWCWR